MVRQKTRKQVPESSSTSDDEDKRHIDALFNKSLEALRKRENEQKEDEGRFENNADIITLGNDDNNEDDDGNDRTIDGGQERPSDAQHRREKRKSGVEEKEVDAAFKGLKKGTFEEQRERVLQRQRREERAKTAGAGWFDMPAFPASADKNTGKSHDGRGLTAEQMRREVQAIRLRNAVDPKRFYRGSVAADTDMPKYAQLGRIISSNASPAATLTRSQRGRTVMEELSKDVDATEYAKRKFNEQQEKRNVGWSSHVRRGGGSKRRRK